MSPGRLADWALGSSILAMSIALLYAAGAFSVYPCQR
jgi:hypothetical protein